MIPGTRRRVPEQTSPCVNETIRRRTEARVARCAAEGPAAIERRLAELDREWDIERCLEANAASVTLLALAKGGVSDRRWFLLPAVVAGFLLQHAVQGWCPPLPVFRRLGFRTADEIAEERYALKVLRGDFRDLAPGHDEPAVRRTVAAVRR